MSRARPLLHVSLDSVKRIEGLHRPSRKLRTHGLAAMGEVRDKKPRGKPFPKGVSGNPSGLPKNGKKKLYAVSKRKQLFEERRKIIAQSGLTPLEFLLSVVRDPKAHMDYRIDASKAAAPYVHRKMPIAIEGGDPSKPVVFEASALTMLAPEEKMLLLTLVEKMALGMKPEQKNLKPWQKVIEGVAQREAEDDDANDNNRTRTRDTEKEGADD